MTYEQKGESDFRIGLEHLPSDALIGSHPVLLRRRPRDDEDHDPDPDDDTPPPPPRDPVSVPDFALQFRPCLEDISLPPGIPVPPGFDIVAAVINAVRSVAGAQADIRHVCGDDGSSHIGVWLSPSGNADMNAARDRGTRLLNPIRGAESFAVFVSANFIKAEAQRTFDEAPAHFTYRQTAMAQKCALTTHYCVGNRSRIGGFAPKTAETEVRLLRKQGWTNVSGA